MSDHGMSEDVASLLRCPVTQQTLHYEEGEALAAFGANFPEGAYLTEDGQRAYPVEDGFLNLAPDSSTEQKS